MVPIWPLVMRENVFGRSGLGPRTQGPLLICVEGTAGSLKGSPLSVLSHLREPGFNPSAWCQVLISVWQDCWEKMSLPLEDD